MSFADLHRAREKQTASFTVLCKDATGENMGRGGDNIRVAVVPKDKKDRFVSHSCMSRISNVETGNMRSFEAVVHLPFLGCYKDTCCDQPCKWVVLGGFTSLLCSLQHESAL